jgi:UDP-2,4-diacetamido-2,4,6-trideoxy-beta-L-altropyranose hydrolase
MRCLTLADVSRIKGGEVIFITREHPGNLIELIKQKGFEVYKLPLLSDEEKIAGPNSVQKLAHAHWLDASQHQDAQQCLPILQRIKPDWLVVDHYAIDSHWQRMLNPYYKKLMVIDDLADRQHDCDLLLDQTYGRKALDYESLVPAHAVLLLGADYALLRPEFVKWREFSLKRRANPKLKQLLITMGGIDSRNITSRVLTALNTCKLPNDLKITVIMGGAAPWLEQVKQQAQQMVNTEVKVDVTNMAEIMANSDLAIGASGSTSWERCCLGLPSLIMVLAENQRKIAEVLQDVGAALIVQLENHINLESSFMSMTKEHLKHMSESCLRSVDGLGAARTVQQLLSMK